MFDISWFFQGLEEFKRTVVRNIMVRLASVTLIFVLVKEPSDLSKYFYDLFCSRFNWKFIIMAIFA